MFVDLVPMRTEFENVHDPSFDEEEEAEAYKPTMRTSVMTQEDAVYNALTSLETDFFLD